MNHYLDIETRMLIVCFREEMKKYAHSTFDLVIGGVQKRKSLDKGIKK